MGEAIVKTAQNGLLAAILASEIVLRMESLDTPLVPHRGVVGETWPGEPGEGHMKIWVCSHVFSS